MSKRRKPPVPDDDRPLRDLLDELEPKPAVSASREEKHAYASALSRGLAVLLSRTLRPTFPRVLPTEDDIGHESPTGSAEGKKRLDVKVWDDSLGLIALVSIKTYSFRDWDSKKQKAGRYSKNIKRNGMELKDEADVIHRRQPYSVMVAVMFMPLTACDDGVPDVPADKGASSFASAVARLRVRTGRALDPDEKRFDRFDLTEKLYIGLYEYEDGQGRRGSLRFFDVMDDPPRVGRPPESMTMSLSDLADEIKTLVDVRNSTGIEWAIVGREAALDEQGD